MTFPETVNSVGQLSSTPQEPGVTQAIATFEAVERVYFAAVAAVPTPVAGTFYAATTAGR